ncbi:hypothetical protein C8Q69DRAFT_500489 [Paecilomyces variotii]|uniref:Uncharacterized protein n=1 Tax=Byssochlamys spectabilis TaxID=264951 RepID=A0A443HN92_BYSSP|nr:hypothetical protein C8Q69DRAFT_500489 [Paecilomyces variotii]RWQ93250.1 hypothetical protein C8Q69DRAFT_500489 [Paecilomyces variotii]
MRLWSRHCGPSGDAAPKAGENPGIPTSALGLLSLSHSATPELLLVLRQSERRPETTSTLTHLADLPETSSSFAVDAATPYYATRLAANHTFQISRQKSMAHDGSQSLLRIAAKRARLALQTPRSTILLGHNCHWTPSALGQGWVLALPLLWVRQCNAVGSTNQSEMVVAPRRQTPRDQAKVRCAGFRPVSLGLPLVHAEVNNR